MRFAVGMLVALLLAATPATAQIYCGPRDKIVKNLKEKFQEQSGGMGLSRGVLFEIWASAKTGTFTILSTTPQNISCVMTAGKDWSFMADPPAPKVYW